MGKGWSFQQVVLQKLDIRLPKKKKRERESQPCKAWRAMKLLDHSDLGLGTRFFNNTQKAQAHDKQMINWINW